MASKHPMRFLKPDPALTKRLRITVTVAGEVMAAHEAAVTDALRDPGTRRELRQLVADLASLLEVIQEDARLGIPPHNDVSGDER